MAIIDKSESSTSLEYKVSAKLESATYQSTIDITLDYSKVSGKWTLTDNQIKVINVVALLEPTVLEAVTLAIKPVSDRLLYHPGLIGAGQQTYTLISKTGTKESGLITMVIGEEFEDDVLSIDVKYTVVAVFDVKFGWICTLKDWTYTETMKWEGTYDITWTDNNPGYPSGELSKYFVVGDQIKNVLISGDAVYIKRMDYSEEFQNTLRIQFSFKGKTYDIHPDLNSSAQGIQFLFNPADQDSWIFFQYNTRRLDMPTADYQAYDCFENLMWGKMDLQP